MMYGVQLRLSTKISLANAGTLKKCCKANGKVIYQKGLANVGTLMKCCKANGKIIYQTGVANTGTLKKCCKANGKVVCQKGLANAGTFKKMCVRLMGKFISKKKVSKIYIRWCVA